MIDADGCIDPQEIEDMANRIDHDQMWRCPRDSVMTPDQRDRREAGVYLRCYARDLWARAAAKVSQHPPPRTKAPDA